MTGFSRRCGVLLFLSLLLLAASPPAQVQRVAKVKFLVGTVKVRKGAQTQWRDAKANMQLGSKDALRTFVESRVEIETEEGSLIKLEENSTMELANLSRNSSGNSEDTKVKMMSGKVWANVKKLGNARSSFAFETPTATAAIRGTELSLEVDENGTNVKVYEGVVYVAPAGGGSGAAIGANQMTNVRKGQRSVKIEKLQEKAAKDSAKVDTTAKPDSAKTDSAKVDSATADSGKAAVDTTKRDTTKVDTTRPAVVPPGITPPAGTPPVGTPPPGSALPPAGTTPSGTLPATGAIPAAGTVPPIGTAPNTGAIPSTGATPSTGAVPTMGAQALPLTLTLAKPAADGEVTTGGPYTVLGKTTAGAMVRVNGKTATVSAMGDFSVPIDIPAMAGPFVINVDAALGTQTKSVSRSMTVKPASGTAPAPLIATLTLTIAKPVDGEIVPGGPYTVAGKTTPGAAVRINGAVATVTATGDFTAALNIPALAGPYAVNAEATLGTQVKNVSRSLQVQLAAVPRTVALTLTLTKPAADGEIMPGGPYTVTGKTTAGAVVRVNAATATVTAAGDFTATLNVPAIAGSFAINVEAALGTESRTISRSLQVAPPTTTRLVPLTLTLTKPAVEGEITTGGPYTVTGRSVVGAEVRVNGRSVVVTATGDFSAPLTIPVIAGPFAIDVEAVRGTESKSISRSLTVKPVPRTLTLVVNSPPNGAVYSITNIPVTGLTTPGATLTLNGTRVMVSATGTFSTTFFIPAENNEYTLELEATLEGASSPVTVTRTIAFAKQKVPLTLVVATPMAGRLIQASPLLVQGQTSGNEVTINGVAAVVTAGQFTGRITVSQTMNWDLTNVIVVASNTEGEELTKDIPVVVDHASAGLNISAPTLSGMTLQGEATRTGQVSITVLDNTPGDEITFTSSIDGQIESYSGMSSGERQTISLQEGTHTYSFYAMDLAKNKSGVLAWRGAYFPRAPRVVLRNPASGTARLTLPPQHPRSSATDLEFMPRFPLKFEVLDLPSDDYMLLKEVRVANSASGFSQTLNSFSDFRFSFDVDLKRGVANTIVITVIDKSGTSITAQAVVTAGNL